jgi:hypothetical protein
MQSTIGYSAFGESEDDAQGFFVLRRLSGNGSQNT